MKRASTLPLALLWILVAVTPALGEPCSTGADAPARPGNDDVIVLLDSSLSMGPTSFGTWARGYMEPAREVLLRLVDCYLQPGDFILVGTFDSEARVEIAKQIARSPRDLDSLREQIRALGPTRPRYWDRRPDGTRGAERASGSPTRQVAGGSLRTDLGTALTFADRVLRTYASPDHRQLILLFTDGEHDPPEFSPYRDRELRLDELFSREAVVHHRLGLVALPGERGEISPTLRRLIETWDPDGEARRNGEVALIELDTDASPRHQIEGLTGEIERLLSMRIDLLRPTTLDLGSRARPRIDERLVVANRSRSTRTVEIAEARLVTDTGGDHGPLTVEPRRFEIPPASEVTLRLSGEVEGLPTGAYRGRVDFRFESAAGFQPSHLSVRGVRLSWLTAYAPWLAWSAVLVAAGVLAILLYRRRPIWIGMIWSDGNRSARAVPKRLSPGRSVRFGGRGFGGLTVDGPGRRLGEVHRPRPGRYALAWETPLADEGPSVEMIPGRHDAVPGTASETVVFFVDHDRKTLERALETLAPPPRDPHDPVSTSPSSISF